MDRAVIPGRGLGDEFLLEQALALLLAAVAGGILKYDVHGFPPSMRRRIDAARVSRQNRAQAARLLFPERSRFIIADDF